METEYDFRKAYFVQTRQEIDTEKRERDHILHLIVLVLGALGFAIIQSEKAQEFLKNPYSLLMEAGTVVLFMALFWLRRAKMQQIADRWFVLRAILKSGDIGIPENKSLEALVTAGLQGRRYLRKDWVVCWAVCIPLAGPAAMTLHHAGWYPGHIILAAFAAIMAVGALAWVILMHRLKCPNPGSPVPGTDSSKPPSESYSPLYATAKLSRRRVLASGVASVLTRIAKYGTILSVVGMIVLWSWIWISGASVPAIIKVTANIISFAFLGSIISFGGLKVFSLQLQSDASIKKLDDLAQRCPFLAVAKERLVGIHQPGNPQFCVGCPLGIDTINDKDRGYLIHNCAVYHQLHVKWLDQSEAQKFVQERYGSDEQ
ncbi:MAG: hypothetical protein NTU78_14850 [Alphaproteobacteria bacterium]|nr:hypothetical protein [Alphaproteobacteria bacterium]